MIYKIKKYFRWLREFGVEGLLLLLTLRRGNSLQVVQLRSRRFGPLYCRVCEEDFEAINTVICFGAYEVNPRSWRKVTVVDLGANIGIATRYFLAVLPNARVIAVEPSEENCSIFQMNMSATPARERAELSRSAVGPQGGIGRLVADPLGRLDSFTVDFSGDASDTGRRDVAVRSLRDVLREAEYPVFLKMDIEGAEDLLLPQRSQWLNVVRIMIEFHGVELERRWLSTLRKDGWSSEKHFDTWHFTRTRVMGVQE